MQLLSPWSLAWLGLLAPLVLLYVLKRRREVREVGSTLLWELALRDMRAERPWKRLVPHVSLILQALAIIVAAVALARPVGAGSVPAGARVAVVIDTSASMAGRGQGGGSGTRMDAAKTAARSLARGLPPGGEMLLIEAGAEPVVVSPPTRDASALELAISRLAVRGGRADLEAAAALGAERLRGAPAGSRIVLITDAAVDGSVALDGRTAPVEVRRVSGPEDNTGIVALDVRARPAADAPDRADVFARIARWGHAAADVYVTASVEGRGVIASRRVRVEPGRTEAVVMAADFPPDRDGRAPAVRVQLSSADRDHPAPDALALDDLAVAPSPGARKLPVFLVGDVPRTVQRVLRADDATELFATTLEELATREPDAPPLDGLIVYGGAVPDRPPPGDSVVVAPKAARVFGVELGREVARPRVVRWDESDARMRFVTMTEVHLDGVSPVRNAAARPLLVTDAGPAIVSISRPDGETTLLALDPDRGDWPSKPSFVVFFRNLSERARARRAAGGIPVGRLGESLRVPAPDGSHVAATSPSGQSSTATAAGGIAIVPVPAEPGVYVVDAGGRRLHALRSLLDPTESDLRARARFTRRGRATVSARAEDAEHRELWPWIAGALLALLFAEAFWATRKAAT